MFLNDSNFLDVLVLNLLFMIIWHLVIFMLCRSLPSSFFDPKKRLYVTRNWEKNGSLYTKKFKIKKWKDYLPQFVAKGGFSKRHFPSSSNVSKNYIHVFILETCRAEWNHVMCSFYFIVSFFVNSVQNAVIFSIIPIVFNFPFIIIQRYNRIRLLKLERKCFNKKCTCKSAI